MPKGPQGQKRPADVSEVGIMPVSVNAAAKYICERSGWTVTQLSLQKILYLAHMVHLGRHDSPLVPGHFEAWDYGPVHPSLHQKVKAYGAKPIPKVFWPSDEVEGTAKKVLDDACDNLLRMSPGQLVRNTHWPKGAWAAHYVPSARNIVIPEDSIIDEYRARMG